MMRGTSIITAGNTCAHLACDDAVAMLHRLQPESVDVVFADPPYWLSGGGSTCKGGKRVAVDKGAWDRPLGAEAEHAFAVRWIGALTHAVKKSGSLWISGTHHSIHQVHRAAVDTLGWRVINSIAWVKPNPPPNLACKSLQHANETILWLAPPSAKLAGDTHFNYKAARAIHGVQLRDVWDDIYPPNRAEKIRGGARMRRDPGTGERKLVGHPTQKPLGLLERIILVAMPVGGVVVDPFLGSGTTLEAAALAGATRFYGADLDHRWVEVSIARGRAVDDTRAELAAA
jgi:site-specific DNA-methyltransferase (adenine-specific)